MTSLPADDPLVALWQTAAGRDIPNLLQDVQRQTRLHRRLAWSIWAIMGGIAVLLIFEEATGGAPSHGILSGLWILGLVVGAILHRRAVSRTTALTLDTASLLKSMIGRAKNDLFVARCLYAGVPGGAVAGYVMAQLAGVGGSAWAPNWHLHMMQLGAGIAALVAMMVVGVVLARSRRLQVRELGEKLKLLQADL